MALKILLADDHAIVRQGVKQLLTREGFSVVGEAADGREAVRLARELSPDIAVLDLGMPLLNGVDAARQILKVSPSTKPIVLTFKKEAPYVVEAFLDPVFEPYGIQTTTNPVGPMIVFNGPIRHELGINCGAGFSCTPRRQTSRRSPHWSGSIETLCSATTRRSFPLVALRTGFVHGLERQPQRARVRFSDDDGAHWSNPPIRVNDDGTNRSQFLPKIASNRLSGNIAVLLPRPQDGSVDVAR